MTAFRDFRKNNVYCLFEHGTYVSTMFTLQVNFVMHNVEKRSNNFKNLAM